MKIGFISLALLGAVAAQAQVTVIANDNFESGALGSFLVGSAVQGGISTGSYGGIETSGTYTFSNEQANGGSQSIKLQRTAATGNTFAWADVNGATGYVYSPEQRTLSSSVDIFLPSIANNDAYFGLEAWGANLLGSIGILGDGRVIGLAPNAQGALGFFLTDVPNVTRGTWNRFGVKVEYASQTEAVVSYEVNGTPVLSGGFDLSYTGTGTGMTIFDFDMTSRVFNLGLGGGATASAYFDNYNLQQTPEPGTLIALGLGALAVVRRKRSK